MVVLKTLLGSALMSVLAMNSISDPHYNKSLNGSTTSTEPIPVLQFSPVALEMQNLQASSPDKEIADELQGQIDAMRKKMKELQKQIKEPKTSDDMDKLKGIKQQLNDFDGEIQKLYKQADELKGELHQKFKQEINNLQKETVESTIKLSAQVSDLQSRIQKLALNQCIIFLQSDDVLNALDTLTTIKNPEEKIANIVYMVNRKSLSKCQTTLNFIKRIYLDENQDQVRALAYASLLSHLNSDLFSSQGSDCTYKLVWDASVLRDEIVGKKSEPVAENLLKNLVFQLPESFQWVASHGPFNKAFEFLMEPKNNCKMNASEQEEFPKPSDPGQNPVPMVYNMFWDDVSSQDGEWFVIQNVEYHGPLHSETKEGEYFNDISVGVMSNTPVDTRVSDKQLWKPIAVSNGQIYLKNKAYGKYLSGVMMGDEGNIKGCYMAHLINEDKTPFYINFTA